MRKLILLILAILFAFPCPVLAEIDRELRFKFGSAARPDRIEFQNAVGHGSSKNGTNAQVEVVLSPQRDSAVRFIMTLGLFHRDHSGKINDLSFPISVDYSVYGMSVAPGLRLRLNDAWNFEGKLEVGASNTGNMRLNSPGVSWNAMRAGDYTSLSLIAGWYYSFAGSASQVGFELGYQKFNGDFEIWSNSGSNWSSGTLNGTNGTANILYGIQF